MWDLLLPALATLGGAWVSSNANTQAANTASQATLQGAQINANAITDSTNKSLELQREGLAQSEAQYNTLQAQSAPARSYLSNVMAGPTDLTPAQQQQLSEAELAAKNQIGTSAIAGSGRTAASILRNVDTNFRSNAIATNTARADNAAGTLFAPGVSAGLAAAAAPVTAGNNMAGTTFQGGTAAGGAIAAGLTSAAGIQANAGTANANLAGSAIGDIGSLIAAQGRQQRYTDQIKGLRTDLSALSGTRGSSQPSGYTGYADGG